MGTITIEQRGAGRWLRWLRAAGGTAAPSAQEQRLEALESELALLREENARLKVKQERPGERPVEERVRDLLPPRGAHERDDDEPWELLTSCLMLRDGLIDACREIEHGMRETRRRLDAILPDDARDGPVRAVPAEPLTCDDLESVA
jgi:hypothetical protein